jgi:hypothetical protein
MQVVEAAVLTLHQLPVVPVEVVLAVIDHRTRVPVQQELLILVEVVVLVLVADQMAVMARTVVLV